MPRTMRIAAARPVAGKGADGELRREIEALSRCEQELRAQNSQLVMALNTMSQGLCMFDAECRLVIANTRFAEMYGFPAGTARPGRTLRQMLESQVACGIYAGDDPAAYVEERLRRAAARHADTELRTLANGRVISISRCPTADGGWVTTHEDVTERRRAEERVAHMARHDPLTDLPNRVLFREEMERALTRVRRGEILAVLCLDLDHFKAVNDTLGHPVGDLLLKSVAERLSGAVRDTDTVARLGGDEFAIIQVAIERADDASILARRVAEALSAPFHLDGHQVVVGASLGIALAPNDGADPDLLLKNADIALYLAKADGRGTYRFFEPEMDAKLQMRRALETDLRQALVRGQFEIYYQPLVNLQKDEVSGFEALLRWNHPARGLVSPADFIPLAEDLGLIAPMGEWVLRQACADAATWPGEIKVAINLSAAQFRSRNLVRAVVGALAATGLPARRLELEITESVLLENSEATLATLHQLRSLGVRISMDDFGTGYSSLSYLRSFPFDKIKIDQSFVQDLGNAGCAAIVRAVTGIGGRLGMTTTAEGVETQEQLDRLRAEGCTEVQGYYFSPPRPLRELGLVLARVAPQRSA